MQTKNIRHRARRFVTQGIYQWLLSHASAQEIERQLRDEPNFNKIDQAHFNALLYGIIDQADTLSQQLAPCLDRPANELSIVEHAVLLIGAYELAWHPDIPYRVVINEAIELAKTYGSIDGYKYVNGVLNKLATQLRAEESSRCGSSRPSDTTAVPKNRAISS